MRILTSIVLLLSTTLIHGQKKLDSLHTLLDRKGLSDRDRVGLLNEMGFEYWIVDTEKSLQYGQEALDLAGTMEYLPGEAKARRIIGVAYWAQGNPKRALENLYLGTSLYEGLGDAEGLANCNLNTGMVYADIGDHAKAMDLYEKAIAAFTALDLKGRIATTYTKMADLLMAEHSLYDAKQLLDNALSIHTRNDFTYGKGEVHSRLGWLFLDQGELEQAEYHIRQATLLSMEVGDVDGYIRDLVLLGKLSRIQEQFGIAQVNLELALSLSDQKNLKKHRLSALKELKLLKKDEGKLAESLGYYDQYIALRDSIYDLDKSKQISALEFENELMEKDRQLIHLNELQRSDSRIKWVMGTGIAIISLLSILLIRSLHHRNIKQRELLESQNRQSAMAMENQRLKQTELENELHFKNKELAAYALNFVQKNELLENLYSQLRTVKGTPSGNQAKSLKEMEQTIRQHKTLERDWEDFRRYFDQVHSNLLTTLKHKFPDLTSNDLKVAALARLNLNIKETSNIMGISPESAKTARYRLRKKLNMVQNDDLFSFLTHWEH